MTKKARILLNETAARVNAATVTGFVRHHLFSNDLDIPCRRWSFLNQFITYLAGTKDARGINQWNQVGRTVIEAAKALGVTVRAGLINIRLCRFLRRLDQTDHPGLLQYSGIPPRAFPHR